MRAAVSIALVGLGSLLAGWVLPMLNHDLPHWLAVSLLILGILLIIIGAAIGFGEARTKGSGISVKMRDGNRIGQIGDRIDRR